MEWEGYALEIRELLGLEGNPVAITYAMEAPSKRAKGKFRVCEAFVHARDGRIIDLTLSTSSCRGGTWHCGLGEPPSGEDAASLKDFLVNGEKLFCTIAAFHRIQALSTAPPVGLADHIIFSPLGEAEFKPDIVLFVCSALQACRLVTLDMYDTGIPPRIDMSGSTCHQAVAYPIVSGELNVSLMDYTSRRIRGYTPGDLLVSIPYHRFHGVMRSIDHCTAGRAKFEMPQSFREHLGEDALRDLER